MIPPPSLSKNTKNTNNLYLLRGEIQNPKPPTKHEYIHHVCTDDIYFMCKTKRTEENTKVIYIHIEIDAKCHCYVRIIIIIIIIII